MEKDRLLEILIAWNFWDKEILKELYPRDTLSYIEGWLNKSKVKILTGVRRSGKSSVLYLLIKKLVGKGMSPKAILFMNLEEPALLEIAEENRLDALYETYREQIYPEGKAYLLFDEIQMVKGWERWVSARRERENIDIIVTGSSSHLFSQELGTLMTGRYIPFEIFPLSFKEFLRFKGLIIDSSDISIIGNRRRIKHLLREYIEFGGFPEVVLEKDIIKKREILKRYFMDILFRDVVERYKIRTIDTLKAIAYNYLTNSGNLFTFNRVKNIFNVSIDVVRNYTEFLRNSYLIFEVPQFRWKLGEMMNSPRKIYTIDTGLRNTVSFRFSEDTGKCVENIVFLELLRQKGEIFYWHNKKEVDFVVKNGEETSIINVAWGKVHKREVEGIWEAAKELGVKKGFIITEDKRGKEKIKGTFIEYIPLHEWLLQQDNGSRQGKVGSVI